MRKIYNIYVLLVAVVAMAFTSCQGDDNNLDASNRRGATTFTANFDASRSYFGEKVDGAYPSYWSGDERVMLEIIDSEFLSIRPSESIAMDIVDEDGKYASFTATIEQEFNGGSVYAYVPAASWEYGTDSWGFSSYFYKLPTTQTPTATSVDPAAHILRAEYSFEGALPTDVDLTFEHVAAYGKLSIPALEGEDVQSVQIDLTSSWGTEYSYTLNVSELDEPTYWFACESDVIMAIGITVVTADKSYTYERTFESGSEVFFSIGHVRPLTVAGELIDPSQPEPTYANNEIHYTATAKVEAYSSYPWSFDTFGANIVSHDFNEESGEGVITFDTDVTTIGDYAFVFCYITSVTIGDSVTTIGSQAFYGCGLTSVTIGDSVTTIGQRAFSNCTNLLEFNGKFASEDGRCLIVDGTLNSFAPAGLISYTIPDSVTTIGYNVFGDCDSLTSITIPDSVTTIGSSAFFDCDSLTSVTIPDSVTTIGYGAFAYCPNLVEFNGKFASEDGRCLIVDGALNSFAPAGLTSYTIPDSVTTIGDKAFYGCKSLTSITIPDSVTTIGNDAFRNCDSLTSVTIPDSVTTIEEGAFAYCYDLTSVTIGDSVTTIGKSAFENCDSLTSVTIGDSVTTIGYGAFFYCSNLTSITIPNSVTTIRYAAFAYCDSLTSVTIPGSVTTIGYGAFYNCSSLTSVYCEATTPPSLDESYVFDNNASGRKIYVPAASVEAYKSADYWSGYADAIIAYDFENGVVVEPEVSINNVIHYTATAKVEMDWTFDTFGANIVSHEWDSESGEGVITFDADVTTIGDDAFYRCSNLTSITIPDSVTTIGYRAFRACSSLTNITIPDSVTTIGNSAFESCSSLKSVTIPDSVTTIGNSAFYNCDSLTSVTIPDSVTTIGEYAFYYCLSLTSVTIPNSVTTIGNFAFSECVSLTSITIPDSVTTIGDDAFNWCSSLTSVTIPDSVTTIGEWAFAYCISLTSITIPDSVTTIGNYAFYECGLKSITIPDSVTTIGYGTFINCYGLTSITIPDSVTTIGDSAFESCHSLTSVTIPDSVTTIGERAFRNCDSLTSVTIPDSVTTIGGYAFYDCDSLTSITIPDSVTTIGDGAFYKCSSLTRVTIPDSVTTIGEDAFSYCSSLTRVTIPDSVTTIGEDAFSYCYSLTSVTIPDSVTTIGEDAFYSCDNLTSITIPDSVTTIGNGAFYYCSSLTSVYCEATTPPSLGSLAFGYWNGSGYVQYGCDIYVPAASVEAYKSASGWSEYADAIVGYDFESGEDTPITDISSPSLKAGDFVSLDGVLGIVYYNDSSVVKVMSVETTTCEWGLYGTSVGANDPDDGRVNVETVKANGCFDFLPGFVWCESLGEGWYFPTIVEMIELYDAKETMNASLSAYGYPQFEGYYWASSEYSSTDAAQFIAASCQWSSCSKSDATNKVCAIRVVNL